MSSTVSVSAASHMFICTMRQMEQIRRKERWEDEEEEAYYIIESRLLWRHRPSRKQIQLKLVAQSLYWTSPASQPLPKELYRRHLYTCGVVLTTLTLSFIASHQ